MLSVVGEALPARCVAALAATCASLRLETGRLIGGRVRAHWRAVFDDSLEYDEAHVARGMNAVDLCRQEAWLETPCGDCVCCLRPVPLKLGARCIECVGEEHRTFVPGSALARRAGVNCRAVHAGRPIFTCVLCDASLCLACLCADDGCCMCRIHLI